ncbi:MAG: hypothetical protein J7623_18895 [Chitinophaga sp.]|uniref:archaemetzincin n=1 Tax=Chitinophaga sp. TaxID=1869181 RepID=UPI001B000BD1|nr:archaemetzincin [Chitinophaga sp.]MBO9730717.1 hypothetical protein [Chitinophaga sp.]
MKPLRLLLLCILLSCHNNPEEDPVIRAQNNYFKAIAKNDIQLSPPKEGEWLFEHQEGGQTFEAYKKAKPVKPTPNRSVIYLLPVGEFTALQQRALSLTREYVALFFQLETVLLKPIPDTSVPGRFQTDHLQLLAPYVLDTLLADQMPASGIALMAISAKDLYPKPSWNYVFGLASYTKRVGVTSIYRLQNKQLDTTNFSQCIGRLTNISSHEIGHMLSLHHCIFARCVMNGSNSLAETDNAPNRLCSDCQKKLYWNIRYDNKKRLRQLLDFCRQQSLNKNWELFQADNKAVL